MNMLIWIGCILLILFLIFVPPHLVIMVAKGLFSIDWSNKYWLVFTGWLLLGMLFNSGAKR